MKPELEGYVTRCRTYWRQASQFLREGEGLKAGELAWGSVVEAVHVVALVEGRQLKVNHGKVKSYLRDLARMHLDKEIFQLYQKGEAFHANFYHAHMDKEEVRECLAAMESLLNKLRTLIRATGIDW